MPKQKTNSSAKKRFTVKKSGVIKGSHQGRRHILTKKSQKRKRNMRKGAYVASTQQKTIRTLVQG